MGRVQRGDGSPLSAFNPRLFKALDFVHALNICDIFGQQDHPRGRQRLPFCPNIPPDRTGKKHNTRPMKRPQEAVVFFVAIPIEIFILLCYTIHTCGCSSSVELRLPKPIRWVRLPSSAPEKKQPLSTRQRLFLFNYIRPIGRDKSRFRGMKSLRDEIRLRREIRTDLISSAKQISSERSEDFIALARFH